MCRMDWSTLLSDGAYKGFHNLRLLKLKITIINKHLNKCTNLRWRQHVFQNPFVNNSVLIFWVYCIVLRSFLDTGYMSAVKYMTESDDVRPRQSPPTRVRTRPELASDVAMNTASRAWADTGTYFYPHTDAFGDNSPGSFSCLRKWSKIIHYPHPQHPLQFIH